MTTGRHVDDVLARDLELVAPLWEGAGERGLAAGAEALAAMLPARATRVSIPTGTGAVDGVTNGVVRLEGVADHMARARAVLSAHDPSRIVTLGGDCTAEVVPVAHLAARHAGLRVLWVDAHADLNDPRESPSGLAHGMALRLLLGEGAPELLPPTTLRPEQCALVATRDLDPSERALVAERAIARLAPDAVCAWLAAGAPVYIHLDLDVLDPGAWPAVAVSAPGGVDPATLAARLAEVRGHADVVGVGVTEYLPSVAHDPATLRPVLAALGLA